MNAIVENLKSQLLSLPIGDRAEIATFLLSSLEEGKDEDPVVVEAAWRLELDRRVEEMESGREQGIPAEEVFAELRKKYQCSAPNFTG